MATDVTSKDQDNDTTPDEDPERIRSAISEIQLPATSPETQERFRQQAKDQEFRRRDQIWNMLIHDVGERYRSCRLDTFHCYEEPEYRRRQQDALKAISDYCRTMEIRIAAGSGVVLFGPPGTGKDHFIISMLRVAIFTHGKTARWVHGQDLFGDIRDNIGSNESERSLIAKYISPDVLVLSDPLPPWEETSKHQAAVLLRIIDGRYRRRRPTWCTLNVADSTEAAKRMGNAAVSRLQDGALTIRHDWPDWRARQK